MFYGSAFCGIDRRYADIQKVSYFGRSPFLLGVEFESLECFWFESGPQFRKSLSEDMFSPFFVPLLVKISFIGVGKVV